MFIISEHHKSMHSIGELVPSGFQLTFANGNIISVQFGFGNYCDNRHESKNSCGNAEIAIWNSDSVWYNFESDQVLGYISADEVAKWIHFAATNTF